MTESFDQSANQSKPPTAYEADADKNSIHSKVKNFLEEEEEEETKNNGSIERCCCCHCCTDLRTKILHENFRLGVVLGFGH